VFIFGAKRTVEAGAMRMLFGEKTETTEEGGLKSLKSGRKPEPGTLSLRRASEMSQAV
jgi:hypothetical protein